MIRLLYCLVFMICFSSSAATAEYRVYIATWYGCEEACMGFQDYLKDEGLKAEFIIRNAEQDQSRLPEFLAEARAERANLILSWGTSVTRGLAGTLGDIGNPTFNHDIPQVFTVVADPVGSGIVASLEKTGRTNVTGTFNRVPETVNIETIRTYSPGFRHLGMLYNTNEKNAVVKHAEMKELSAQMGFKLTGLELRLGPDGKPLIEDVAPKVAALKAAGVDFIYVGSSSFLHHQPDAFTGAAVDNGIPVLSPYEKNVRESQALLSVAARYYEVGRLAGVQAKKILLDRVEPGDLPVLRMTDFAIVVNMAVAKKLNLYPPLELLQVAETLN